MLAKNFVSMSHVYDKIILILHVGANSNSYTQALLYYAGAN